MIVLVPGTRRLALHALPQRRQQLSFQLFIFPLHLQWVYIQHAFIKLKKEDNPRHDTRHCHRGARSEDTQYTLRLAN